MKIWFRKSRGEQPLAAHGGVCVELGYIRTQNGVSIPVAYPFKAEHAAAAQEWVAALRTPAVERKASASSS